MNNKYEFLSKYAINITAKVGDNKIDPVIGREEEIRNVIRILSRKTKNNPVLIGEPGVGKTAIVEGLAHRIINHDVPENLENKEIYSLDIGSLIAGTKYQGEFEERLKGIINEVVENNDRLLLFIDEIHLLIGAGQTSGAMDAANLLKPMLARGELNCIGATTLNEYRQNIEKDSAFERRFQKVIVFEPTVDEAINILRGLKSTFEGYHGVIIDDEAIVEAVVAANRYINDRFLPDKAIDLIDEASANIKVQINSEPEELQDINYQLTNLEIEKKALKSTKNKHKLTQVNERLNELKMAKNELDKKWKRQKNQIDQKKMIKQKINTSLYDLEQARAQLEYERAAEIEYAIIPDLRKQLTEIDSDVDNLIEERVTVEQIYLIISRLTNIPLSKLQNSDKEKLLNLKTDLERRVKGQETAIIAVNNAILRNRVDLTDDSKPIGSFLFLGPTGVGKTEVAKTLSWELFDDENKMFRIDMSEYMEKHTVSRLIGAPPGYIGYEQGGALTEYVRRNPYSVILFDEIEKAHPDVLNILLQILDDGRVTDSKGITVNFKNTIIIMTSNIASQYILQNPTATMAEINPELHQYLKPEFINRIDVITKFNPIDKEVYAEIIVKNIDELINSLKQKGYILTSSAKLVDYILNKTYTIEFGARPIKRFIETELQTKLAYHILEHNDIKHIAIEVIDEEIMISSE